ncbi:putative membrane protein [Rhizobium skierniewicense]|uniref:Putative membrane protein n=1 Tax=Rhizobium skierniewicense TaxID=984260 RepID=A0A7W6G1J8_9HYPH|nr:AzlD family protein [Rhizobium skierniewicense]MBB3945785.1 putative membrane protein [Rhizobium skierniewicense]
MNAFFDAQTLFIIFAGAIATYITRVGGYVLMTRMKTIPPRVEAGLNAVPVAVLTTLVAPAFFEGGYEVKLAMIFALIVGLRFPGLIMLGSGWALAVAMRHFSIA